MVEAKNRFEEELIRCAQSGDIARFAKADNVEIRAKLIRDLLVDAEGWVHANGVYLAGARITGQLDCMFVELRHPLFSGGCDFDSVLMLQYTSIPALNLPGCNLPGIEGSSLRVAGDVLLRDGLRASGEVRLLDAKIGGNLDCSGGIFENNGQNALLADRAQVAGSLLLCNMIVQGPNDIRKFHAIGEVRLLGAEIGSNLDCRGGKFENAGGDALSADGAKVTGNIFLGNSFHAIGTVSFIGAEFGGQLNCSGGIFENKNGNALAADQAKIKGSTFLDKGFHAVGEVRLSGTETGGQLSCARGTFENESGSALVAERASIGGILDLREMQFKTGAVNFGHASAGLPVDDAASWPANGSLILDGFEYRAIGGKAPIDARSRLDWLGRQADFRPATYRQLAKAYRNMSRERDARKIDIARHRRESKELTRVDRGWSHFFDATASFGYEPIWLIVPLIFALFYGFVAVQIGLSEALFVPTRPEYANGHPDALLYSIDTLIPFVDLVQETRWVPKTVGVPGNLLTMYFLLHRLVGWYVGIMATAAITGLLRRNDN